MNNLYDLTGLVHDILKENEQARNSDNLLFYLVCKRLCPYALEDKFGDVLMTFSDYDLPHYESVGRARRKVQEAHPELAGNRLVKRWRAEKEAEFREYGRAGDGEA